MNLEVLIKYRLRHIKDRLLLFFYGRNLKSYKTLLKEDQCFDCYDNRKCELIGLYLKQNIIKDCKYYKSRKELNEEGVYNIYEN